MFSGYLEEKYDKVKSSRAPIVLYLVHMILLGPSIVTLVSQGHYILTFVDEFSRLTQVYFLHHKNEVVHKLQDFKKHVEHKARKAIKVLWMDNENRYVHKKI